MPPFRKRRDHPTAVLLSVDGSGALNQNAAER
jgi:hypothetical protein